MPVHKLIIELAPQPELIEMAAAAQGFEPATRAFARAPLPERFIWDASYSPVEVPSPEDRAGRADVLGMAGFGAFGPVLEAVPAEPGLTFAIRGEVENEDLGAFLDEAATNPGIRRVFTDELIQAFPTCGADPSLGSDQDVARELCVDRLHGQGMDGRGVLLAVVDGGVNTAHLSAHGKPLTLDASRSWTSSAGTVPGSALVGHGTMCAYDAAIAAPACSLADLIVLRPGPLTALLSDAVKAYEHLLRQIRSHGLFDEYRALVVSNSWGVFHPSWDQPVGTALNYSDNPNHTFNRIVATLERYGADIVFAAGNCGKDCPDLRCIGATNRSIYGANSHPSVLCVGGVDTTRHRVGYSSIGPGRLMNQKPDLCAYTHFSGSGVYPTDSGTSAAAPVAAGVLAAVRSRWGFDPANPVRHPASLRQFLVDNVDPVGLQGHSMELGWGIIDGCALAGADLDA